MDVANNGTFLCLKDALSPAFRRQVCTLIYCLLCKLDATDGISRAVSLNASFLVFVSACSLRNGALLFAFLLLMILP